MLFMSSTLNNRELHYNCVHGYDGLIPIMIKGDNFLPHELKAGINNVIDVLKHGVNV
jgi:hypothetical protein